MASNENKNSTEKKSAKKKEVQDKKGQNRPKSTKLTNENIKNKPVATAKKGKKINIKFLGGILLKRMANAGAKSLGSNADEVNKLNVFPVPDGDTGDNMRMTIESGISAIENIDSDNLADVMKALSHGMLLGARGNSGVILSQFFAGTAKGLESSEKANPTTLGKALEMGVKQAYSSVMTPTEGTILTVAREAVEYAVERITPSSTIRTFFSDLVKEMHASVERTPELLSVLRDARVVDSGGAGLFYIMDGFNRVLNGEEIPEAEEKKEKQPLKVQSADAFGPDSEMIYGYCTELLLQLTRSKVDIEGFDMNALKAFLNKEGDSVVAFKTDSIVKVHIHTFAPERILAHMRSFGEFLSVKIENMSVQHSQTKIDEEELESISKEGKKASNAPSEVKRYGIVAVSNGEGVSNLFRELGADEIILGGQTNNPSTRDFLDAFSRINCKEIFVLPNNGNILMAASQAAELSDIPVHVLQTKSIGAGYVALTAMNLELEDSEGIISEVNHSLSNITVGYISPSIRDADLNGIHIENGDTIGIIDKEVVVSSKDRIEAIVSLVSRLISSDKYVLTVFVGLDATEEDKTALSDHLNKNHPNTEVYYIDAGQEIYPFLFVAE